MNQFLFAQIDESEVDPRRDLADLIPNRVRNERGLGVIDHDAFLVVEPALILLDLRDNQRVFYDADSVDQLALRRIEYFALPGENIYEMSDLVRDLGPGRDNGEAVGFASGNIAGGTLSKEIVELFS